MGGRYVPTAAQEGRDAVCPPQAHPQARPSQITRTNRRARRAPPRSHRPEPQEVGEAGTDTEPQAGLRSSQIDGGASARQHAPDLLRSIGGLVQQNRPIADEWCNRLIWKANRAIDQSRPLTKAHQTHPTDGILCESVNWSLLW
jgi:hypothetical protein